MKTSKVIGIAFFAVTFLISCGSGDSEIPIEPDIPIKPVSPEIKVPDGQEDYFLKDMVFESIGGKKVLAFESNVEWNLTSQKEDWYTFSPKTGKTGQYFVNVEVAENTFPDERNAVLTLTAKNLVKKVKVIQKQKDALTLTKNSFNVGPEGGQINVEVKANISYEVVIPQKSKEWISRKENLRGLSLSKLIFNVKSSEEADKREGEIIIKSDKLIETIHVYQAGKKILLLSQKKFNIAAKGENIEIGIKSNFNYAIKMPQVDWVLGNSDSRGISNQIKHYTIKANNTYSTRNANIIFYDTSSSLADTLRIIQDQKNVLIVNKKEFHVKAEGETVQVKLSSNIGYDVNINCNWITKSASRGLTENIISFVVKRNEGSEKRSGKIIIESKDKTISETVMIYQLGRENQDDGFNGTGNDMPWS